MYVQQSLLLLPPALRLLPAPWRDEDEATPVLEELELEELVGQRSKETFGSCVQSLGEEQL